MHVPDGLPLETAQKLVAGALDAARAQGIAVAACVVDSGGHLIAFARMDGVSYMAVEVTRRKAVTSGSFGLPTRALSAIASSDPAVAADLAKNPDVCMVGGGVPVMLNGRCVGGLGVGGGRGEQDHGIAENAVTSSVSDAAGTHPR